MTLRGVRSLVWDRSSITQSLKCLNWMGKCKMLFKMTWNSIVNKSGLFSCPAILTFWHSCIQLFVSAYTCMPGVRQACIPLVRHACMLAWLHACMLAWLPACMYYKLKQELLHIQITRHELQLEILEETALICMQLLLQLIHTCMPVVRQACTHVIRHACVHFSLPKW